MIFTTRKLIGAFVKKKISSWNVTIEIEPANSGALGKCLVKLHCTSPRPFSPEHAATPARKTPLGHQSPTSGSHEPPPACLSKHMSWSPRVVLISNFKGTGISLKFQNIQRNIKFKSFPRCLCFLSTFWDLAISTSCELPRPLFLRCTTWV